MILFSILLAAAVSVPAESAPSDSAERVSAVPVESVAARAADPAYLPELLTAAHRANLAADTQWLRLGHWRKGLLGWKSEAAGPSFFVSREGKTSPSAELDATIRGFFTPPADREEPAEKPQRPELMHPQCRFPARLAFLAQRLVLDPQRLPLQPCPRFEAFWKRAEARSVTLVFSSYYLNNPGSTFGHTLLRLNKQEAPGTGERFELLDQGASYAAEIQTSNPLSYAFNGFFGGFRGVFSSRPYFYKVREYADSESRDLWEYDLELTQPEVAMLVAHLWELGGTWFNYWYATQNCSYHILGALEAAAPRLHLLSRVGKITIPADTVKAVAAEPGLVRKIRWRASIRTQFTARAAVLDDDALDAVETLARDPGAPLPGMEPIARAKILDTAVDLVDVRFGKAIVFGTDPGALRLRQTLLSRRAEIPVTSSPLRLEPPQLGGPESGHGSWRWAAGGGGGSREGARLGAELRVALHDLLDPIPGFSPRSELEMGRLRIAYFPDSGKLRVEDAWLMEFASVNPFDRFDRRMSWHLRLGAEALRDRGCAECLVGKAEFGAGPGHMAFGSALTFLATLDAELAAAPRLSGLRGSGFRPGVGPSGLVRVLAGDRVSLLGKASWRWFPEAAVANAYALGAEARVHVTPAASLALELRRGPLGDEALLWTQLFR